MLIRPQKGSRKTLGSMEVVFYPGHEGYLVGGEMGERLRKQHEKLLDTLAGDEIRPQLGVPKSFTSGDLVTHGNLHFLLEKLDFS